MRKNSLRTWKKKKNPFPKESSKESNTETNQTPEALINPRPEHPHEENSKRGKGFFACYLLTSLCPRYKGHTYIGFTVNPRRRIRQHNGEIVSGAFRTKRKRPWEMVICIYGFPTNVSALQFEWAWQHPKESVNVREAAATFKTFSGVANKIKLAYTMLNLPAWKSLNITVNYFSTKYTNHSTGCPSLPENMKFQLCPMDDLPCYAENGESFSIDEDANGSSDDEGNEKTGDQSGNNENGYAVHKPSSMDEFLSYNGFRKSLSGDGYSNCGIYSEEECGEDSNRDHILKEKNGDSEVHFSADYAFSFNKTSLEQSELLEEYYRIDDKDPRRPPEKRECDRTDEHYEALKEINAEVMILAPEDYAQNIDKGAYEKFGNSEKSGSIEFSNPPATEVDHERPFDLLNSPDRSEFPMATSIFMTEPGDLGMCTVIDDNSPEFGWQRQKKLARHPALDKNQPLTQNSVAPHEIEVIDLLSPTPECRTGSRRKKTKVTSCGLEVIDLT